MGSAFKIGICQCLILFVLSSCTADQSDYKIKSKPDRENADAQYQSGLNFYKGQGVPKDYNKAFQLIKKAAGQGHANAQYQLGMMYDYEESLKAHEKLLELLDTFTKSPAETKNFAKTMLDLTQDINRLQAEAVKWYKKAALQGQADAQHELGEKYYLGFGGLKEDHAEAARWTKMAAEQGHDRAQYELGVLYHNGEGVSLDHAKAVQWWEKAADQGNPAAVHKLGLMYYKGQGTPQNLVKAYSHLIVAWTIEKKNVKEPLLEIGKKLTPAQIDDGQRMAQILFDKIKKRYPGNKAYTLKKIEDLKGQET